VPVVFLDPGINRTASLPNVNLTTLARYAIDTRSFQSQVILHGPKKISNFLWRKAHRLDVMPGQHTTNAIEGRANKGKKGNRSGLLRCGSGSLRWIQGPSNLPFPIAVPLESVPQEFKFIMKTFAITQGSGPVYQRGEHSLFIGRVMVGVGMATALNISQKPL
jgi:hypothetical protein